MRFTELDLRPELLAALDGEGFHQATPIQEQVIRPALEGHDIIGVAQTGTGKTLAFLVPIFQKLEPRGEVQVIVVCPTRELALQVGGEADRLAGPLGIRTAVLYGGTSLGHQREALIAGLDVVVGTPGRLIDFMGSAYLRARTVRWLVLDEADRMLDMGFLDDVKTICSKVPMSRQTMLFSATIPAEIAELSERFLFHPKVFRVAPKHVVASGIEQELYMVAARDKPRALLAVLRRENPDKTLVFTATREATSEVARMVRERGFEAMSLSSLLSQANRERAMAELRSGSIRMLVATDVAGRGIDITDITHVINYDLPTVTEDYVHRIGRTGRMERTGKAISFATPADGPRLREIEALLGQPIPRGKLEGFEEPAAEAPRRPRGRGGPGRRGRGRGGKKTGGSRRPRRRPGGGKA
jgi:ATP-dependent RNA helicase RhlE